VTLARYKRTPWRWSLKIETCRSTFKYFYYFNKINTLDEYSVDWKVHVLVFYRLLIQKSLISDLAEAIQNTWSYYTQYNYFSWEHGSVINNKNDNNFFLNTININD